MIEYNYTSVMRQGGDYETFSQNMTFIPSSNQSTNTFTLAAFVCGD